MDILNDKFSVKTLLFSKVFPNYGIPGLDGHKTYPCTGCGDKFIFESSLNDHINRKSVSITYMCRNCNLPRTFFNRCNLLVHIRSHGFRTATINVTDLILEPLPLSNYKINPSGPPSKDLIPTTTLSTTSTTLASPVTLPIASVIPTTSNIRLTKDKIKYASVHCFECKVYLPNTGFPNKDRATHYMQFSNDMIYSCPICLFALPSVCAFKAHLRLHLKFPPYCCPECGIHLSNKNVHYPYCHDCEGFKMMRATARLSCNVPDCHVFHPNDHRVHMKDLHMKKVYKCPHCVIACLNTESMQDHFKKMHSADTKPLIFYKCELCPGKFVLQNRMEWHTKTHKITTVFPCWPCSGLYKDVSVLLNHFLTKHCTDRIIENALIGLLSANDLFSREPSKQKRIFRVVKRCDQCRRSFVYRCQYTQIHNLPHECPFKCSSSFGCSTELSIMPADSTQGDPHITCHLCKTDISQDWKEIKKHYAALHKTYKCLDAKIVLTRIDLKKYLSQRKNSGIKRVAKKIFGKSRRQQRNKPLTVPIDDDIVPLSTDAGKSQVGESLFICNMCGNSYEQKILLERHMISHRDPCMAYQCMECGQSFVVKPSFSKHLLLEHNVSDIEEYIKEKQCYNENALIKYQSNDIISNEPLRENQCKICRKDFEGPEELAKHFRVHGMAFLMKNNSNRIE